jgi:hypothetical protein
MITSAVVSAWLWVHVGILLVTVAYATCGSAILPGVAERGRAQLAVRPTRVVLIGLGVSVPWVLASIILLNLPNGAVKLIGAAALVGWAVLSLAGLASVSLLVGDRNAAGGPRWAHVARGAACVSLTWMLPVVGWFVMLPLSLAAGLGCLIAGRPSAAAVPPPLITA